MGRALLVLAVLCCGVRSSVSAPPSERDVRAMYEECLFPPLPISRSDQIASTPIPRAYTKNNLQESFFQVLH